MIGKIKHMNGTAEAPINYIIGGKLEKDQIVKVVAYNGICLSQKDKREIELVPRSADERQIHKHHLHQITQKLASVFNARASLADYRVNDAFQHDILSYSPEDNEILTPELQEVVVREFLEGIGVHGDIEVNRRRKSGKFKEKIHRDAMFLACTHCGTNALHNHVFTCRIDERGKANDTRNERYRALKVCRQISKKYGLHLRLNGNEVTKENGYTICQQEYHPDTAKSNSKYAHQICMKDTILQILEECTSWADFEKKLEAETIFLRKKSHSARCNQTDIFFTRPMSVGCKTGEMHEPPIAGTKLCKSLSYAKINERILTNNFARQYQMKFVIHSCTDATLFCIYPACKDRGLKLKLECAADEARRYLLKKIFFVGQNGMGAFAGAVASAKENGYYRVGTIEIDMANAEFEMKRDGYPVRIQNIDKVLTCTTDEIFGRPELTAPNFVEIPEEEYVANKVQAPVNTATTPSPSIQPSIHVKPRVAEIKGESEHKITPRLLPKKRSKVRSL